MRRNSPPGLSGRRGCGPKKGEVGSVWEVVSSLASALTEARDQLVTLINNSKPGDAAAATRMRGGSCSRHSPPSRPCSSPYPGASTWVRNVHRAHAHGHVAFGCSSEYRLHPSPVRVRRPRPLFHVEVSPPPEVRRSPRRCTHPLHKMHVLPESRAYSSPCVRNQLARPASCNPKSIPRRPNLSPDQRRHCIGTQYAALLREELYRMRERRMADQNRRGRRLPWGPC